MKARRSIGADRPRERGFVLIGVVMFVLALTILGLSLFSLSGYEAQFLGDSRNAAQAFYDATGGIDRARYMLVTRGALQTVKDTLTYDGPDGVIYARARYNDAISQDSIGAVDWSGARDIEIRTLAVRHGIRRMVECRFHPHAANDYYKRLFTSYGQLRFIDDVPDTTQPPPWTPQLPNTYLTGDVWLQSPVDMSTWYLPPPRGPVGALPHVAKLGGVPHPDVVNFMSAHWAPPTTPIDPRTGAGQTYDLNGTPGVAWFYKTDGTGRLASIDDSYSAPTVNVKGYAVWMVNRGMHFKEELVVNGSAGPNSCLIIVAQRFDPSHEAPEYAIRFFGGITSNIPVILVADGDIDIEQVQENKFGDSRVDYLSIFAGNLRVIGPASPGEMQLTHNVGDPHDLPPHGLIDVLYSQGALPNPPTGQLDRLTRVSGTWREVTESYPI